MVVDPAHDIPPAPVELPVPKPLPVLPEPVTPEPDTDEEPVPVLDAPPLAEPEVVVLESVVESLHAVSTANAEARATVVATGARRRARSMLSRLSRAGWVARRMLERIEDRQ